MGNSKYLKGELVYEKEHDRFRCPEGKYLIPNPAIYRKPQAIRQSLPKTVVIARWRRRVRRSGARVRRTSVW